MSTREAEAWLFGPALAVTPPRGADVSKLLNPILQREAGSNRVKADHLRHSFASYLLATLMLPQDDQAPAVPAALTPVISPARFHRVADRLLGNERLGAGSLHAVSQLMGHTGPSTTIRYYCHLLDLSLGLYCARPATLIPADSDEITATLGVARDSRRRAGDRAAETTRTATMPDLQRAKRPGAGQILQHTPKFKRKLADARSIHAGLKRLARGMSRVLELHMQEVEIPRRRIALTKARSVADAKAPSKTRPAVSQHVHWRAMLAHVNQLDAGASDMDPAEQQLVRLRSIEVARRGLPTPQLEDFVDMRLRLSRRLRKSERVALEKVVHRFQRGRTDVRLTRLRDAEAFVRLLGVMGFTRAEIELSLTSRRGFGMSSEAIHHFLSDRTATHPMAGRSGWRGSLIVRFHPTGLAQPVVADRACRFALVVLAMEITAGRMR